MKEKKTVYLHIGYHKTGTTALQHFAASNADFLLAKGVQYCNTGRPKNNLVSHSLYPLLVLRESGVGTPPWFNEKENLTQRSDRVAEAFTSELAASAAEKVLLSSEEFILFSKLPDPARAIERFMRCLDPHEVRVICYLREPLSFWKSWYNQHIKCGSPAHRFSRFWLHLDPCFTNYVTVVDEWISVVGRENVTLVEYSKLGTEHIRLFLDLLGVETTSREIRQRTSASDPNPSLEADSLEIRRVGNHIAIGRSASEFLSDYDSPEASLRRREQLEAKLRSAEAATQRLISDYEFGAAVQWSFSVDDLLRIEQSLNRIATNREDDVNIKIALFLADSCVALRAGRGRWSMQSAKRVLRRLMVWQ